MRYQRVVVVFPKESAYTRKDYSTKKQIKDNVTNFVSQLRELISLPLACFSEDLLAYTFLPEVDRISVFDKADQALVRPKIRELGFPYEPETAKWTVPDEVIQRVRSEVPTPDRRKMSVPEYMRKRALVASTRLRTAVNIVSETEPIMVYLTGNNDYCNVREEAVGSALITIRVNIYTGVRMFSFSGISLQEDMMKEVLRGVS